MRNRVSAPAYIASHCAADGCAGLLAPKKTKASMVVHSIGECVSLYYQYSSTSTGNDSWHN